MRLQLSGAGLKRGAATMLVCAPVASVVLVGMSHVAGPCPVSHTKAFGISCSSIHESLASGSLSSGRIADIASNSNIQDPRKGQGNVGAGRVADIASLANIQDPRGRLSARTSFVNTSHPGKPAPPPIPSLVSKQTKPAKKWDFVRDIRPILADKCFTCHGQDPEKRQVNLRLDVKEEAYKLRPSGNTPIVPFKPDKSRLVQRIYAEEGLQMPPPTSGKILADEDKRMLKEWIQQGAVYKPHWAFVAAKRPPLPKVRQKNWPRNAIDSFILAKLEEGGLKPSHETDKRTLIRRVSLDLTGLPPLPDDVTAFLKDRSANAYEKVVDRLLASPTYGERMGQDWLDDARYADSNGYQADYERYQWRWRDWVIDAYNKNMPFDQFTIEQLAGDMLPNATESQKIATGFNRNHRINTEGGVIAEEWRVETVVDRLETTGAVWMGLTVGCARCHSHKFDPITQKEFYRMYAYYNNVPESGTGEERPVNHPPIMKAPRPDEIAKLAEYVKQLDETSKQTDARLSANAPKAADWKLDDLVAEEAPLMNGAVARYALTDKREVTAGKAPTPIISGKASFVDGHATGAVKLVGEGYLDLGDVGDFDKTDAFSYSIWINPVNGNGSPLSRMDSGSDYRGWDLYMAGMKPMVHIINKWPANALKIVANRTIPNNEWTHIFVTYDGSAKPEGLKMYVNGEPTDTTTEVNTLTATTRTPVTAKIGTRTGTEAFAGLVDDVILFKRVVPPDEVRKIAQLGPARKWLSIPEDKRTAEQKTRITALWSDVNDADYRLLASKQSEMARTKNEFDDKIPTLMVMAEMEKPRDCFILTRGQYDKHGERVKAGLPAFLPPLPKGAKNDRLGFAKWLVDPSNPLTPRVVVNRMWEKFFGTGIVATTEDFGTRGEYPSHPELLDWLATEFIRLKWDMKAMQKEILMSATYRQSSNVTEALEHLDPQNRLLARGPRFRLSAEVIRDQALAICGLLVEKLGGPSVRPYMPGGIWDETNVYGNLRNYMPDKGEGLYRRSMYTIWKRTAAPPTMLLFDVPGREMCRVRRSRTNTPLQALALLNEETFVEASRVLAEKMMTNAAVPRDCINYAYRRALGRDASEQEFRILFGGYMQLVDHYRKHYDDAKKLVSIGDSPRNQSLIVPDLAAYTMIASTILNLDETITKE